MRRLAPTLAFVLVAAACSRDLDLPSPNRLAVAPEFATVAPRQTVTLAARGGAGGYSFAFAQGGKLSGSDAAIDRDTGAYLAGGDGSAQDVIEVADRAGTVVEARITVTARIVAAPGEAYLSPGASLKAVVSGGRTPYTLALVRDAGSTGTLLGDTYTAGAEGDVVDRVRISDLTADPAAVATVVVHVGPRVRLYPPSASVAPREALAFVGLGGDPPYTFSIAQAQSGTGPGAPSISPDGTYVAGANAGGTPCTDVVRVTDALGQTSETPVLVGAPLALSIPVATVQPGVPVQLVATGGKAPYTFAFDSKGNRSAGAVSQATGVYTPGPNYGARDLLQVRDVTGALAALPAPPVVGAEAFSGRAISWRCAVADVNGDGRDDAVLLRWDPHDSNDLVDLTTVVEPAGRALSTETYWLPPGLGNPRTLVADLDGDGHDELWLVSGVTATPLVPDLSGRLSLGPARTLPAAGRWGAAPIAGGLRFFTSQTCTAPGPRNGVQVFDWLAGGAPGAATCTGLPWTTGRWIVQIAAGDVNGDGYTDAAWTEPIDGTAEARRLLVAHGTAGGTFPEAPSASLLFPDPGGGVRWVNDALYMDPDGGLQIFPAGVGAHVADAGHGFARAVALWRAGTASVQVVDPFQAASGGGSAVGFRVADGVVVVWDETKTTVAGYAWDPTGTPSFAPRDVLPVPTPLQEGPGSVCLADLDGDGRTDLLASSAASGGVSIYRGDGGGTYGLRARFDGPLGPDAVAAGFVDQDGLADLVVGTATPGLTVLWGGEHQLARAVETRVALAPRAIALGDWLGAGVSALVLDEGGNLHAHPVAADGAIGTGTTFTPSVASWPLDAALVPVRFDGDAGAGFWSIRGGTGAGINYYYPTMFVRSGPTAFQSHMAYPPVSGTFRCAVSPVGRTDGGGAVRTRDVVELCTPDHARIDLWRAAITSRSPFSFPGCAFDDPGCSWGAAPVTSQPGTGTALAAGVAAAGRLADGAAVLVGNAGSSGSSAAAWALVVRSPATDGAALTTSWISLGSVTGPVESAAVGDLDGDAFPDLVLGAGERIHPFLGSSGDGTGGYTPLPAVPAAGRILAIQPLAGGAGGDVLMLSGQDVVPLQNDGAGNLR